MPPQRKFTKEFIVDKALLIARRDGINGITARNVAKELNTSSRPIFTFYSSMEELKEDVIQAASKLFLTYIKDNKDSGVEFRNVGMGYINFAIEEKELFKILFMDSNNAKYTVLKILNLNSQDKDEFAVKAQKSSGLNMEKSNELYKYMWMFSHAIATLCITGIYSANEQEIIEMLNKVYSGMVYELSK